MTWQFIVSGLLHVTTWFVLLLVLVGLCWRHGFARMLLFLLCAVFYFSANGVVASWLVKPLEAGLAKPTHQLIISHQAMIVLGGGTSRYPKQASLGMMSYSRILMAAAIYHQAQEAGIDYTIFLSGGAVPPSRRVEANLMQKTLVSLGVEKQAIIIESHSQDTRQNASYLRPILKHYPFKRYLLVTGGLHMKRAQLWFAYYGIKTDACPSDFPFPVRSIWPLGYNLAILQMALHEHIGMWQFYGYKRFGITSR